MKQAWCCDYKGVGCATTTQLPYQCWGDWQKWGYGQRAWCCLMEGKACETSTTLPYDCDAGYVNWECGWSQSKKEWCCKNRVMGCPKEIPYDCEAGVENLDQGWSIGQKAWCCLHGGHGCDPPPTPAPDYDCLDGLDQWYTLWPTEKQDWCCKHEDRACYHCDEGLERWHEEWSIGKKDWCCRHYGQGCEAQLHSTECTEQGLELLPVEVSAEGKREWCCRHHALLCSVVISTPPPFDCDTEYDMWTVAWTDGQKAWCCIHRSRGCDEDDPARKCWDWVKDSMPVAVTTPEPTGPRGYCLLWGDSHIETFDHSFVTFISPGVYWLVKSQDISIQASDLATPFTEGLAAINSIVVGGTLMQGHRMEVGPMDNGQILWDGRPILRAFPSDFDTGCCGKVSYNGEGILVDTAQSHLPRHIVHMPLPHGVHIQVMRWAQHINIRIEMNAKVGQDGHCGNFNQNKDDDTNVLITERVGNHVLQQDCLFTNGEVKVQPLQKRYSLDDCPADKLERAKQLCMEDRPESEGELLEDCTFDVCFGGDQYAEEDGLTEGESKSIASSGKPITNFFQ